MGASSPVFEALRARRGATAGMLSWALALGLGLALGACASATPAPQAAELRQRAPSPEVEVVSQRDDTPEAGDGAPLLTLAFRLADGTRVPIEGEAVAFTPFRDGAAITTPERSLWLVSPDGARRRLAVQSAAPPALEADGALLYAALYGETAELHRLTLEGRDTVIARDLRGVGLLAPQPDGSVLFVGASAGGVAGLWVVDGDQAARCVTNCGLRTGQDWGESFIPAPPSADAIQREGDQVRWPGPDGALITVSLTGAL